MKVLKKALILAFPFPTAIGLELSTNLSAGYISFVNSSHHRYAYVKNIGLNFKEKNYFRVSLLLNEANFKNKKPHPDFSQAQIDFALGYKAFTVGFHYLPYAKPSFTEYAKGIYFDYNHSFNFGKLGLTAYTTELRNSLKVYQFKPYLKRKIAGISTFVGLNYQTYSKRDLKMLKLPQWNNFYAELGGVKKFGTYHALVKLAVGKRIFAYFGRNLENHPQEHRYSAIFHIGKAFTKQLKMGTTLLWKYFREVKSGKKANAYGLVLHLNYNF
jgi:hypothetical protein